MNKSLKSLSFACLIALASACGPSLSATGAAIGPTASRAAAQTCGAGDLSSWKVEGMNPAVMQMQLEPAGCGPNGSAQLRFAQAGEVVLVREIPTPGFALVSLHAVTQNQNTAVRGQIWGDGRVLSEAANAGTIDIKANVDQAGPVQYKLLLRAMGPGMIRLSDVRIDVKKRG